jgi:hypothetical protein
MFLKTWLSNSWNSRILGGKGESAVPYIHVDCLNQMIFIILKRTNELPTFDTYIASPDGSISHKKLFNWSTRWFFGKAVKPIFMPKLFAMIGVRIRYWIGLMRRKIPFERPWMIKYIDQKLTVDASYSRSVLDWNTSPRKTIDRRLLHMIERMKSYPLDWHARNTLALKIKQTDRPNLVISHMLQSLRQQLIDEMFSYIFYHKDRHKFESYQKLNADRLIWYIGIIYDMLITSIRTGDRLSLANYARFLANIRSREGFQCEEVCRVFDSCGSIMLKRLLAQPPLKKMENDVRDAITLPIQLAIDEIMEAFNRIDNSKRY